MPHHEERIVRKATEYFFDHLRQYAVEFDVFGQSDYPWWHGTLNDVRKMLRQTVLAYDKDIVVIETACPWTGDS